MKRKDRFCIIGNIDSSRTLPYGTPDDVAAPGGGYILGFDHSLRDGIAVENTVTAEYGREIYAS